MSKKKRFKAKQFPPEIWHEANEIANLSDKTKRSKAIAVRLMYARQSPYPPPEEVQIFQQYCPDFLERVMALTEKTVEHSMEIEKELTPANIDLAHKGMIWGGFIAIFSLTALIVAIIYSSVWLGAGALFTAIGTIIASFVTKQVKR